MVSQQGGEGNFHVFYQLLSGCHHNPSLASAVQLDRDRDSGSDVSATEFAYLTDTEEKQAFVRSPAVHALFQELVQGLGVVGVTAAQQEDIFRVVAAVLRLGNTTFTEDADERCSIDSMEELERVCALVGLSVSEVGRCFVTRQFGVRSIITCHLTLAQV